MYDQRIHEVEYGCFSPLIFSTSGGLGPVSTLVYKRIAQLQSEKFRKPYTSLLFVVNHPFPFEGQQSVV